MMTQLDKMLDRSTYDYYEGEEDGQLVDDTFTIDTLYSFGFETRNDNR